MLMEHTLTELFLSVPAVAWPQLPKELFHTTERDLLMLTLSMVMLVTDIHMLDMLMDMFHSVPALVWTQSPKVLTQSPRVLLLTMERDSLMPMLMLSMVMLDTDMDILMLMELMLMELFHLDPALVWTQSPKVLTQSPRELLLTMERGPLMLMLSMLDIHMPMLDTPMLMDMFHLEAALELTQSPKVWTQSLKDLSTKRRVKTGG